jgi:hypothetical protein
VTDFPSVNSPDYQYPKKNCAKKYKKGDRQVFYPSLTPHFSSSVQISIKTGAVLYKTSDFVRESSIFLRSLKEYPLPTEYTAYCRTLVDKYPILKKLPGDFEHDYVS